MNLANSKAVLTESTLSYLIEGLSSLTSVNFRHYKRSFMQRRILRQLVKHNLNGGDEYIERIFAGGLLSKKLINDLAVHVTRFFRDPPLFKLLGEKIFPYLWKQHLKQGDKEFRIWIMGCSTGEEAYSAAITLLESARPDLSLHPVRIFATDLDEVVIEQARKGEYGFDALNFLQEDLVKRYFLADKTYRVTPELRRLIAFGQHDLLKNPFIHHLDMIFCRNVMIFLNREAQDEVCQRLHESLNPGGILVLGKAETPTRRFCDKSLLTICRYNRVYQKGPDAFDENEDLSKELRYEN